MAINTRFQIKNRYLGNVMTRNDIHELNWGSGVDLVFIDGFDDAIVGLTSKSAVCYDVELCIGVLMEKGLTLGEAIEHFYLNIECKDLGVMTPIFVNYKGTDSE